MILKFVRKVSQIIFAIIIFLYPLQTYAVSHDWVAVPNSIYGKQLWDKNTLHRNQDESLRVLSKFIPKSTAEITKDILYTMDIDCSEKLFRDVALGTKEFNEFKTKNPEWADPNGDKLILGVIDQVCTYWRTMDQGLQK